MWEMKIIGGTEAMNLWPYESMTMTFIQLRDALKDCVCYLDTQISYNNLGRHILENNFDRREVLWYYFIPPTIHILLLTDDAQIILALCPYTYGSAR